MKVYENYRLIEEALKDTEYDISDYKKILNKFEDEQSKLVFFNRIMLDNTNDPYYGINLELASYHYNNVSLRNDREMFNFYNFLLKDNNYKNKIYQIGIPDNRTFPRLLAWQSSKPLCIECIFEMVENEYEEDATGGYYIPVKKIESISTYSFDEESVFVISHNHQEYYDYLINELNINKNRIFVFREEPSWEKNYQYFCESFFPITEDEIYLDCGVYDLRTIVDFRYWAYDRYRKIYAFEPVKELYYDCLEKVKNWNFENIEMYNIGLWNKKDELKFSQSNFGDSKINDDGEIIIPVDSIDNILNGQEATFIKYDIEGSEYEAIEGTKNTIQKYKPKLAVSVYHLPNDIIKLTLQVLSYNENYKIYARHYGRNIYETNLYFIEE